VSRFNAVAGVSLDWLSVTRRDKAGLEPESKQSNDEARARGSGQRFGRIRLSFVSANLIAAGLT
jgi:hypothetical protein